MMQATISPLPIPNLDLDKLNAQFENADPKRILKWCVSNIDKGLLHISTFNIDDVVITDILYRVLPGAQKIPVVFVDSLHHFPETLQFIQQVKKLYNIDLKVYKVHSVKCRQSFQEKYGNLWEKNQQEYQLLTQQEPLKRAITELQPVGYIQGNYTKQVFSTDLQGKIMINPFACWNRTESWAYAYEHDLVYNPLYDKGHSIIPQLR